MHRQRQERALIIRKDVLQHFLLPFHVLPQRLPPISPPQLVRLGKALLDAVLGEVLNNVGSRAPPIAGMIRNLLAQELLNGRVEGGVAGVADGVPDVLRGLEAARQGGGVQRVREGCAVFDEVGPEGRERGCLGDAFGGEAGVGPGYGAVTF